MGEVFGQFSPLEKEAASRFQDEMADKKAEDEGLKADKDIIRKKLRKCETDEEKEELKSRFKEAERSEREVVNQRRYRTNDATIEKLAELNSENPQGILVCRDELVGLLKQWEKPGNEHYRAYYLEAWTGTNPYTVDRVTKGTQWIPRLCLSVFGGIQPDRLQSYLAQTMNGGNDGMLQRFQLLVFPDPPKWEYVDRQPNYSAKAHAGKVIKALADITDFTEIGARVSEDGAIPAFQFDDDAQQVFVDWITDLEENKLRSEGLSPYLSEHFAKYRSLMPSLALIFHLINVAASPRLYNGPIKRQSAVDAVAWCRYLESHAIRVYDGLGQTTRQAAVELSKKISESLLPDPFTVRDVQQKGWYLLTDNKVINNAIAELIETGWIREVPESKISTPIGGRPPAPKYCANPNAKKIYSKH